MVGLISQPHMVFFGSCFFPTNVIPIYLVGLGAVMESTRPLPSRSEITGQQLIIPQRSCSCLSCRIELCAKEPIFSMYPYCKKSALLPLFSQLCFSDSEAVLRSTKFSLGIDTRDSLHVNGWHITENVFPSKSSRPLSITITDLCFFNFRDLVGTAEEHYIIGDHPQWALNQLFLGAWAIQLDCSSA